MPTEDSDREQRRRRRPSRDPESDRERRRDDTYRRRRGHRATDSQGDLLPRGGDRSSKDYGSNATPRSRRESRATSSSRSRGQQLSTSGLAQLDSVNKKQGYDREGYDADYLEEVREKEKRMEKERRREEREARRAERAERHAEREGRAERHADREERRRMSEMEMSGAEMTDRERRKEQERERRREEKRQQRRAEKVQAKEAEKQRQLELAQEQAEAEARERQRDAQREKQRQLRKEQEMERQRRRELQHRRYDDDDSYASSPLPSPQKTKWRSGAAYGEVRNEDSPRAKYFEKAHSPKRKSRVISGPYLEDQHDEVYEYRKDKLEGSSQASDYTSTTIWKKKRNKRICEAIISIIMGSR